MHQPTFGDIDTLLLLGRSRTYELETTNPIHFPVDVNPVPSIVLSKIQMTSFRLLVPVHRCPFAAEVRVVVRYACIVPSSIHIPWCPSVIAQYPSFPL